MVRMTDVYRNNVAPAVNPVIVEERLEAEVEQGLVLSGQPNLIIYQRTRQHPRPQNRRPDASVVRAAAWRLFPVVALSWSQEIERGDQLCKAGEPRETAAGAGDERNGHRSCGSGGIEHPASNGVQHQHLPPR